MFSYRHAFHAGNHADVLKHVVQILLLDYLLQKPKALRVIDTHAGAGIADLHGDYAQKSGESANGIGKLWTQRALSVELTRYMDVISSVNAPGVWRFYPGSPAISRALLRPEDSLHLFELHPSDLALLSKEFAGQDRAQPRVYVNGHDGFAALKSLLPPPTRRGLILIDPPYEDKQDYSRVVQALEEGLRRFATGTYAIWYPCLARHESRELPNQLKRLPITDWLQVELAITGNDSTHLVRSGMFVINPPWVLKSTLQQVMPELVSLLGLDHHAHYVLSDAQTSS